MVWWGNLKERDHSKDQNVEGRKILKYARNMMGGSTV
jgi:hypothetical protein